MYLLEFLKKPLTERQSHIELSDPCVLHPVKERVLKMSPLRQQHFDSNGITLESDLGNLSSHCHVCHLCLNSECRNYYHTYLGTPSENFSDRILEGSYRGVGEFYNNGYFEIKITSVDEVPKGYVKGRLPLTNKKVSKKRKQNEIKNATNGNVNIQVRTALGETLPEGFYWGYTVTRTEKTCPHCGKTGKGPNMTRYHFSNCKDRVKFDISDNRYED
jgi:hypothetical protein